MTLKELRELVSRYDDDEDMDFKVYNRDGDLISDPVDIFGDVGNDGITGILVFGQRRE